MGSGCSVAVCVCGFVISTRVSVLHRGRGVPLKRPVFVVVIKSFAGFSDIFNPVAEPLNPHGHLGRQCLQGKA